jgi:hypothetical protein
LVRLFQKRPSLAVEVLRDALGIEVPPHRVARNDTSSFSELSVPEYRADGFTVLDGEPDGDGRPRPLLGVVIEVQLAKKEEKRRAWLAYSATSFARLGCVAHVLVVAPNAAVARWAKQPLHYGIGCIYQPLVLGPEEAPAITDPEEAKKNPYLAVLCAILHGHDAETDTAVSGAAVARDAVGQLDDGVLLFDLIKSSLGEAARKAFEMLPETYQFQDEALQKSFDRGQQQGQQQGALASKAADVIAVLEARGLEVTDEQRERITSAADLDLLDRWVRRAATISATDELFAD